MWGRDAGFQTAGCNLCTGGCLTMHIPEEPPMMSRERLVMSPARLTVILLAVLSLVSLLALPAAAQQPPRIVFIGDSLTAGLGVGASETYVERLREKLGEKGLAIEAVNAGVSGDTTSGGLSRLDWSVPDGTDGVVLALGGNDALRGIPVAETRANLAAAIENLQNATSPCCWPA